MRENSDRLRSTIRSTGIIASGTLDSAMVGKPYGPRQLTEGLLELLQENQIEEMKWLDAVTDELLAVEKIVNNARHGGKIDEEFHYFPVPGHLEADRLKHPKPSADEATRRRREEAGDILYPELKFAPEYLGRTLAWRLHLKSNKQTIAALLVLTYDPDYIGSLHFFKEELRNCKDYWARAAMEQYGWVVTNDTIMITGLTGLHEWAECLGISGNPGPRGKQPRHQVQECDPHDMALAAKYGLAMYYSSKLVAHCWSTGKISSGNSVIRAKAELGQALDRRIIVTPPIYGLEQTSTWEPKKRPVVGSYVSNDVDAIAQLEWNSLIREAVYKGYSDIHVEPTQGDSKGRGDKELTIAMRQDGQLTFLTRIANRFAQSFLDNMLRGSGVGIAHAAESPMDGRRTWNDPHTGKEVDLRISASPTLGSFPKIVARILDMDKTMRSIKAIGLDDYENELWDRALKIADGISLVSGPTGSGKSQTLFAAMNELHTRDDKRSFCTFEDPVEYRMPFRCVQHPITTKNTFARFLRQQMRNDGDTIMVGEIRDKETAIAALELAQTGHQIWSSIHAQNSTSVLIRFMRWEIDKLLLSTSLKMSVAQRLPGKPCPYCAHRTPDGWANFTEMFNVNNTQADPAATSGARDPIRVMSREELEGKIGTSIGFKIIRENLDNWVAKYPTVKPDGFWVEGVGCQMCRYRGIKGRRALQEFTIIGEEEASLILEGEIAQVAVCQEKRGLPRLAEKAWELAWRGIITISQAEEIAASLEKEELAQ